MWDSSPDWIDKLVDQHLHIKCSKETAYTISGSSPYLLPHGGIGRKLLSANTTNTDYIIYNLYVGNSTKRNGIIGSFSGETVQGINDKGAVVQHKLVVISGIGTGELITLDTVGRIYGSTVSLKSVTPGLYFDSYTISISY